MQSTKSDLLDEIEVSRKNNFNFKSDDSTNLFYKKILLNRFTYLPIDGRELITDYTDDTIDYFERDASSIVEYRGLIISTICYKPIGNYFLSGGAYSWGIQWLVINPIDKYLKLILTRKDLYNEIQNKNGNKKIIL